MAEYTIRKPDYDEIILPAVNGHRPRPHDDLAALDGLLAKTAALGEPEDTDRCMACGNREASAIHLVQSDSAEIRNAAHPFQAIPERTVMIEDEATVDLTDAEASLLHGITRQWMRRSVDARRAVALRYLLDPLKAAEEAASVRARVDTLDDRIRERKEELRRLALEERETSQRVENLRSREARATEGAEA